MRSLLALALLAAIGPLAAQDHAHHHAAPAVTPPPLVAPSPNKDNATNTATLPASHYQPPALTDADRAAAFPPLHTGHDHGDPLVWMLQADQLEWTQDAALAWSGKAWVGHDRGRLWLRSAGERAHGNTSASLEALWGRPLDAWWDVFVGVRHDTGHGPARDWLALGVQGLAPYKFEVQATAYVGSGGRSMLQVEAEYEVLLTNKLILQPRIGANVYGRDDPARGIGSGLSDASVGLRLRYEVRREFAPYIGYQWVHRFERTAIRRNAMDSQANESGWVAGLRFLF